MTTDPTDPATGRPYASLGQRIGAFLVDHVLAWVLIIATLIGLVRGTSIFIVGAIATLAFAAYQWHGTAVRGQSIGKRIVGIRVADVDAGAPIGWSRAFVRYLVLALLGLPLRLGQIAMLFVIPRDERRQGWQDKAARSVVVQGAPMKRGGGASPKRFVSTGGGAVRPTPQTTRTDLASPGLSTTAGLATAGSESGRQAGGGLLAPPPAVLRNPEPPSSPGVPSVAPVPLDPSQPGRVLPPPPGALGAPPRAQSPVVSPQATPSPTAQPPVAQPPTVLPPVAQTPLPQPPVHEIDDHTRLPVRQRPPIAGWRLVGPVVVPVAGTVVIGREPSEALVPGATVFVVADATRSMSKTHASLVAADGGLTVEDLDSTNGVYLSRGGVETRVPPRTPTALNVGESVLFGDVTFVVERSP